MIVGGEACAPLKIITPTTPQKAATTPPSNPEPPVTTSPTPPTPNPEAQKANPLPSPQPDNPPDPNPPVAAPSVDKPPSPPLNTPQQQRPEYRRYAQVQESRTERPFHVLSSVFSSWPVFLFPVLVTGIGFYQRRAAWNRIRRGERWHTKSRGISHLSAILPLPEHIIQRFVEPLLCLMAGLVRWYYFSLPIGGWLAFSGGCLMFMEAIIYDVKLNNMLGQLDGMVEVEIAAENDAFFRGELTAPGKHGTQAAPSIAQMAGITVGFAPDLQRIVAQRRAAKAARDAKTQAPQPIARAAAPSK
jgi:hypothetical protein